MIYHLSLKTAGMLAGLFLLVVSLVALASPTLSRTWATRFPRSAPAGYVLLTLAAVWTENPFWVSMPAVGILLPQAFWMLDFLSTAVGHPLFGMTNYMFDAQTPLFHRGLSFFHFWLPILIVAYGGEFLPAYRWVAWLAWVPNLALAEWMIRRRRASMSGFV